MLRVESDSYYAGSSSPFNKNNAGTYTYQSEPQALDNFPNNQSFLEANMVEGSYSTSEQYYGNEGSMVVPAHTSLLSNNCEVTEDTANLTGEQIFPGGYEIRSRTDRMYPKWFRRYFWI